MASPFNMLFDFHVLKFNSIIFFGGGKYVSIYENSLKKISQFNKSTHGLIEEGQSHIGLPVMFDTHILYHNLLSYYNRLHIQIKQTKKKKKKKHHKQKKNKTKQNK